MNHQAAALPNELTLVAKAKVNSAAFAAIYDHYFSRIYNYARYRLPDAQSADDLTAEIFERALKNIDSYRPKKAPFSAWLFAIARNAVNDHLLHQAGLTKPGSTPSEYDELLELARRLAGTDFSRDSKIRPSLRRKLLNQIEQTPLTMVEIPSLSNSDY